MMGRQRDPWFIEASPFNAGSYGAYPDYEFHFVRGRERNKNLIFQAPSLSLPTGLTQSRLTRRTRLLKVIESQRRDLNRFATTENFDSYRQGAISLLTDASVQRAFDVTRAKAKEQDRYGRNAFGWSLLMARRLVEAGVNLVQVNLGNNETWDTHDNGFPLLKDCLLPPTDRAVSALLDDLQESGLLDETLIVMCGEMGRTPKINTKLPGRDHWGAVQTVFFAGGGIRGGNVVGSSDAIGAYPATQAMRPENVAATIYNSLGIPRTTSWKDELNRPHHDDFVADIVVFDEAQERFHQHDAAAAGAFEIVVFGRVGNVFRFEAVALVFDFDANKFFADLAADQDRFLRVHPVAVFDGVDECFFQCESNAEHVSRGIIQPFEAVDDASARRVFDARDAVSAVGSTVTTEDAYPIEDHSCRRAIVQLSTRKLAAMRNRSTASFPRILTSCVLAAAFCWLASPASVADVVVRLDDGRVVRAQQIGDESSTTKIALVSQHGRITLTRRFSWNSIASIVVDGRDRPVKDVAGQFVKAAVKTPVRQNANTAVKTISFSRDHDDVRLPQTPFAVSELIPYTPLVGCCPPRGYAPHELYCYPLPMEARVIGVRDDPLSTYGSDVRKHFPDGIAPGEAAFILDLMRAKKSQELYQSLPNAVRPNSAPPQPMPLKPRSALMRRSRPIDRVDIHAVPVSSHGQSDWDALDVQLAAYDRDGRPVSIRGTVEWTLLGREQTVMRASHLRFSVMPGAVKTLANWTRSADTPLSGATPFAIRRDGATRFRLPFPSPAPAHDLNVAALGELTARVLVPGQGVFVARRAGIPLRQWGFVRDGLTGEFGTRFLPQEPTHGRRRSIPHLIGSQSSFRPNHGILSAEADGPESIFRKLLRLDPSTAGRLHPNDQRRVIRALEVHHLTGRPLSEQQTQPPLPPEQRPEHVYWLEPDRAWLRERIGRRVTSMMEAGLVDEVRRLLAAPVPMSRTARQGLGYKELIEALAADEPLEQAADRIRTRTCQFAKRQYTWFRNLEECQAVPIEPAESAEAIASRLAAALAQAKDAKLDGLQKAATAAVAKKAAAEKTLAAERAKFQALVTKYTATKLGISGAERTAKAAAPTLKKQQDALKAATAAKQKADAALAAAKAALTTATTAADKAKANELLAEAAAVATRNAASFAKGKPNQKAADTAAANAAESAKLAKAEAAKLAPGLAKAVAAEKAAAAAATKTTTAFNTANAAAQKTQQQVNAANAKVAKGTKDLKAVEAQLKALRPTVLKLQADYEKLAADALAKQKAAENHLVAQGKFVSFSDKIAPIFARRCMACHNARTAKGRFNMESFTAIMKGGESGEAVEKGKADESTLYAMILDGSMPKDADPLTKSEMAIIKKWIDTGAKLNAGVKPTAQLIAISPRVTQPAPPKAYRVAIPVTALAFSPDGKQLASSGYHEVIVWDPVKGTIVRRITDVAERVYNLDFSPDGKLLAVAAGTPGQLGEVKLFDTATGKRVADLVTSDDSVFSVAFSPDGKRLASGGADRAIRIFDVATRKLLATIEDHADWVMDVAWSPDGTRLASASRDKTSKVFDMTASKALKDAAFLSLEDGPQISGDSLVTYNGHGQPVFGVAFSSDGKTVITSGSDKQVRVWGVANAKLVRAIKGFGGEVFRISVSKDGRVFSSSADKNARVHTFANGKVVSTLGGHTDWVYSIAHNPATKRIATGTYNGEVRIWNAADGKQLLSFIAAPGLKEGVCPPATVCESHDVPEGEPKKLVHRIEAGALDHLPGEKTVYLTWQSLEEGIRSLVDGMQTVAMEYSPRNANPYVSRVDAGTVELVRSFGCEIVSSGDLIQRFEAVWTDEQWDLHQQVAQHTNSAFTHAWNFIADEIRNNGETNELSVQKVILDHFTEQGMTTYHPPIVAVNAHSGNPHYETGTGDDNEIREGDFVLIDLWAKFDRPNAVYSDLTRVGFVGETVPEKYNEIFTIVARARDAAIECARVLSMTLTAFLCLQQTSYSQTGAYGGQMVYRGADPTQVNQAEVQQTGFNIRNSISNMRNSIMGNSGDAGCAQKPCAGPGCADAGCASNDCCDPCCPEFWEHRTALYGEFLYLTARGANVNYGTPVNGIGANAVPIGHIGVADPDYDPGFRIGGTWKIDSCSSFEFTFTQWDANTENSIRRQGGNGFVRAELVHPNTANVANDSLFANTNYDIGFELYDASYKGLIWGGCDHFLNYVVGLRYSHLDQDLVAIYSINGATRVDSEIDWNGFGPRFGLEGERLLGGGVFLYGKGFLSVLMGEFDVEYRQANVFAGQQAFTGFNDDRVVPVLEVEVGAGWQSCCGKYRLSAGYYFASWFNAITTQSTISALQQNRFEHIDQTITFDGLTARAEVRW
eukprot:g32996.t1